jgi:LytS/YehU family sensor histidine kinase
LVYSILRRWPFQGGPLLRTILTHLGLGFLIATLHEVTTSAIYYAILQHIGDFDFTDPASRSWAYSALIPAVFSRMMEYGVLMGVLIALENARVQRVEHEQLLELKHELQISQLNALKKQLQPHFLFNTLNTVSALMDEHIGDARTVLSRLGQLLRVTLDETQKNKVRLEREVDHIANYLGIETMRFRDRLNVEFEIPGELMDVMVPSMVLQPLVENAIKHGPDASNDGVHIHVKASKEGDRLWLEVQDNGRGCSDVHKAMNAGGIGLRNVRDRLQLLYGDKASFNIYSPEARGFHVRIGLPIERKPEPDQETPPHP